MMKLKITPFTDTERKEDFVITEFEEDNKKIAFLTPKKIGKMTKTKKYRFGIKKSNNLFWFFNGEYTANDRETAIKAYLQLKHYFEKNGDQVFINKK